MTINYDLLVITGPTASGKTALAATLASRLNGRSLVQIHDKFTGKWISGPGKIILIFN